MTIATRAVPLDELTYEDFDLIELVEVEVDEQTDEGEQLTLVFDCGYVLTFAPEMRAL